MTSAAPKTPGRANVLAIWGLVILMLSRIWLDRRWPGSLAATLAFYANMTFFVAWFGSKTWMGYRRRRPYWTADSWRRYLRLAAMPLAAVFTFLALVYLFDARRDLFGSPQSAVRMLFIVIDLVLMCFGVVGLVMAIDWLEKGEPSEQFTRTRWFRRGGGSAIAN